MRAIVYYVERPMPFELHGLDRIIYDDLTTAEARLLMRVPAVREPAAPLETVEFRGRTFNRHEDNRVLIQNKWGITDVYVANRRHYMTMLLTAEDLATLREPPECDA
jgi:hypothetical protein